MPEKPKNIGFLILEEIMTKPLKHMLQWLFV